MSQILKEILKTNNRWAQNTQSQVIEAVICALGNTSTSYNIQFKNGFKATDISGPANLSIGNSVIVSAYPGKIKKFVIIQKTSGGNISQGITTIQV